LAIHPETVAALEERVGDRHRRELGTVTALLIRRYARAVGEDNPLYYDAEHARTHGYRDVIAPPNLVTGVIVWDEGPEEQDLRRDGTPPGVLADLPHAEGLRVMGGGEEMVFHAPITAGTVVYERTTLVDVAVRDTKSGPMGVLTYEDVYEDADGNAFVTTTRTGLAR
jgi:acyl dehydratase